MASVLNQPAWGELEGLAEDVNLEPTKQIVMIREVTEAEAPKRIVNHSGDVVFAAAGDVICYSPGEHLQPSLDEYEHWALSAWDFTQHYHPWDSPERQLSSTEQHLMELGCKPYYKAFSQPPHPTHSEEETHEESFLQWLINMIKGTD